MGWDGKTERRKDPTDHDNITRTLVVVEQLVKNFDAHVLDDKKNFTTLFRSFWVGIGFVAALRFISGVHLG